MLYRLRNDFRLSLIVLLGASAVFALAPFGVYRFMIGDLVMGIIDSIIVIILVCVVAYAWFTGDTRRAGFVLVIMNTSMAVVVGAVAGVFGLFWLYVVLLSNFFLAAAWLAMLATAVALIVVASMGGGLENTPELISFLVTAGIVSLFAYIFAHRTEVQRLQLEKLATIDPLTGVGNRRTLENELKIAMAAEKRHHSHYGLMMLDLDNFKDVNDQYGHATGDEILKNFVRLVQTHTRRVDRLFRFGGEEFVLLLPATDHEGLRRASRHLTQCVRDNLKGPGGPVTVSAGAAILRSGEDWENWLRRADQALYAAKAGGRNQAVMAQEDGQPEYA